MFCLLWLSEEIQYIHTQPVYHVSLPPLNYNLTHILHKHLKTFNTSSVEGTTSRHRGHTFIKNKYSCRACAGEVQSTRYVLIVVTWMLLHINVTWSSTHSLLFGYNPNSLNYSNEKHKTWTWQSRQWAAAVTCSLALSSCLTRSSRSCAGKCRAPTSSSPSLCLVMVILRSCVNRKNEQSSVKLSIFFLELRNFDSILFGLMNLLHSNYVLI